MTAANDRSLWIQDPVFGLVPIAREGSTIHLGPGDDRTLETIHAAFMTNADRFTRSISNGDNLAFNDRGEVVFRAELTDGSHAVIVTRLFPALIVFEDGFESGTLDGWSASSP